MLRPSGRAASSWKRAFVIATSVHGNTSGLKSSQSRALKKLGERRVKRDIVVTLEIARPMAALSRQLNRAVGVLIDRRGRIQSVIVGDARRLYLPDIGRQRGGGSRFRGVRLVRTTLGSAGLTNDDLTDLSKLQLDAVAAIEVGDDGEPDSVDVGTLVPDNPAGDLWRTERYAHVAQLPDEFSRRIAELEAEFEQASRQSAGPKVDRAMIVYVRTRDDWDHEARLAEIHELCRTAGVDVVEAYVQSRQRLDPKTAVGSGALEDIELRCLQLGADILVFGQDLSPAQSRSVGATTNLRVLDRTQLILDIFAQRAQSRVGKLQVELAQQKYRLPRLSGRGTAMSRLAGGIGGRGPGEAKLEIDRRRARDRIVHLERQIEKLRANRALRRRNRQRSGIPVVSIVGYTNAGKSTLLNTLTNSAVVSEDKLFATLDPTTRRLRFPEEREVVLTDTVGFIRDLPDELREAFRATLEELDEADLLLHVVDASDPAWEAHMASTERILDDLDLGEVPRRLVFNKVDLVDPLDLAERAAGHDMVFVSALDRSSTRALLDELDRWLVRHGHGAVVPVHPVLPDSDGGAESVSDGTTGPDEADTDDDGDP